MPKKAGMEKWKKKRRQEHLEKREYRYYIFCEGQQTEPLYFEGFKRLIEDNPIYRDMVLIEIEPCQAETMRVIGMAEQYVKKNKIQKGQIPSVYKGTHALNRDICPIFCVVRNRRTSSTPQLSALKSGQISTSRVAELSEDEFGLLQGT